MNPQTEQMLLTLPYAKTLIGRCINTLNLISISGEENMQRVLGILQTLDQVITGLPDDPAMYFPPQDHDHEEPPLEAE